MVSVELEKWKLKVDLKNQENWCSYQMLMKMGALECCGLQLSNAPIFIKF